MPAASLAAGAKVLVNGSEVRADPRDFVEVVVDQRINQPAMAEVRYRAGKDHANFTMMKLGDELAVEMTAVEAESPVSLFDGEVTAVEGEYDDRGTFVLFRAYDRAHRLHRTRVAKTFEDFTDDKIISRLADDAGVTAEVASMGPNRPFAVIGNATAWEVITAAARRHGCTVRLEGTTLKVEKPAHQSPVSLDWEKNLRRFRPRARTAGRVDAVEVHGWNPNEKKEIVGKASLDTKLVGAERSDLAGRVSSFAKSQEVVVPGGVLDAKDANERAKSYATVLGASVVEADGVADGAPNLVAGGTVSVTKTGAFDGTYVVSAARHTLSGDRAYRTHFTLSGLEDRSLPALVQHGTAQPSPDFAPFPVEGLVPGVVTNTQDPDELARVRVQLPWLSPETETGWARVLVPGGGPERGLFLLPEVGDEVLVGFEHGDLQHPYVLGGLYNGQQKPYAKHYDNQLKTSTFLLRSRGGHEIRLADKKGESQIELTTAGKECQIVLDEKQKTITINSAKDVKLEVAKDATINVGNNAKIAVTRDAEIKATGNLALEASQNVTIKAGMKASIEGGAGLDLKTNAIASLKGSIVKIN